MRHGAQAARHVMGATFAVSALIRKRAELAAEAKATAALLDRLGAGLVHLDASIRFLCPDLAKPKVTGRGGCDWFGRGELGRTVLDILRDAPAPMQVEAIRGRSSPPRACRRTPRGCGGSRTWSRVRCT